MRSFLAGLPGMGLPPSQEAALREMVEDALAMRAEIPQPGDPDAAA